MSGCMATGGLHLQSAQTKQDWAECELVAIVRLSEGRILGNFPMRDNGIDVKEWACLPARTLSRAELGLSGVIVRCLKGHAEGEVTFNIQMSNLTADRDGNVFDKPGENIPPLIIGKEYLIMKRRVDMDGLHFACIWPANSYDPK